MGLDVILQTEFGEEEGTVADPHNVLVKLLPPPSDRTFRFLPFIDPYGNTVFNRLQVDELILELNRIQQQAISAREVELLDQIKELAERVKRGIHMYLKFEGD